MLLVYILGAGVIIFLIIWLKQHNFIFKKIIWFNLIEFWSNFIGLNKWLKI